MATLNLIHFPPRATRIEDAEQLEKAIARRALARYGSGDTGISHWSTPAWCVGSVQGTEDGTAYRYEVWISEDDDYATNDATRYSVILRRWSDESRCLLLHEGSYVFPVHVAIEIARSMVAGERAGDEMSWNVTIGGAS